MAPRLPNLGPRTRKVVRYLGFVVLGLVTFVFAFQMTFPFDRVKDKIIDVLSEKYEVAIGGVERGFLPGRIYFKSVSLRTRPTKPDEGPTTFYLEQLEVDLGIFALVRGTAAVTLDAQIGSAHLEGNIALSKAATSIEISGDDLPSARLPVREALGLPMSGKVQLAFELQLPNDKLKSGKVGPNWPRAEGRAEISCRSGCTVGDGKTKLKFNVQNQSQQAFAQGGIDFGKVNIDTLQANLEIKDGKMRITKFDAKSGDGELHIDFDMTLNQDLNQSMVAGCLRFNGSQALLKREPKTHSAISATGAPLGPDNLFHIKLDGPLRQVKRLPYVCGAAASKTTDHPGGPTARPNLTVTPEAPAQPPTINPMPQPSPSQPPPATAPPAAVTPTPLTPEGVGVPAPHLPPSGPNGDGPAPTPVPPLPAQPPSPPAGAPPPAAPPPPTPAGDTSMQPPPGVGQ